MERSRKDICHSCDGNDRPWIESFSFDEFPRGMYEILLCAMRRRSSLDNPDTVFSRKHTVLN